MNKNFRRLISLLLALTMALGLLQIPAFAAEAPAEKAMEITAERVPEEDAAAAAMSSWAM